MEIFFQQINDEKNTFSDAMTPAISMAIASIERSIINIEQNNKELDLTEENNRLKSYLNSKKVNFTLIELVVTVGILAILLAITLIILQTQK